MTLPDHPDRDKWLRAIALWNEEYGLGLGDLCLIDLVNYIERAVANVTSDNGHEES